MIRFNPTSFQHLRAVPFLQIARGSVLYPRTHSIFRHNVYHPSHNPTQLRFFSPIPNVNANSEQKQTADHKGRIKNSPINDWKTYAVLGVVAVVAIFIQGRSEPIRITVEQETKFPEGGSASQKLTHEQVNQTKKANL